MNKSKLRKEIGVGSGLRRKISKRGEINSSKKRVRK